jgi:hypothetical protein
MYEKKNKVKDFANTIYVKCISKFDFEKLCELILLEKTPIPVFSWRF